MNIKIKFLIIGLLLNYSCKTDNQNYIEVNWEHSKLNYSVPPFYLEDSPFKSKVGFIHEISIKNNGNKPLKISLGDFLYEFLRNENIKQQPIHNLKFVNVNPHDSVFIKNKTNVKFTAIYNPNNLNDSIYNRADKIFSQLKLVYTLGNDTLEIKNRKSFFLSEIINLGNDSTYGRFQDSIRRAIEKQENIKLYKL